MYDEQKYNWKTLTANVIDIKFIFKKIIYIYIYIYVQGPISNVYENTSSVDCTQYGLYNLEQYDHNQILNDLFHITLLHTINICAE